MTMAALGTSPKLLGTRTMTPMFKIQWLKKNLLQFLLSRMNSKFHMDSSNKIRNRKKLDSKRPLQPSQLTLFIYRARRTKSSTLNTIT